MFLADYMEHVSNQIENPGSAEARVPFLLEAAYDYFDGVRWIATHDPAPTTWRRELRKEAVERLALWSGHDPGGPAWDDGREPLDGGRCSTTCGACSASPKPSSAHASLPRHTSARRSRRQGYRTPRRRDRVRRQPGRHQPRPHRGRAKAQDRARQRGRGPARARAGATRTR